MKGKPFAYTSLRATYKREVDAARSFADWNSPDVVTDAESWIKSAYKDDLTFNWFYTDSREVAYFNTGANPVRGKGVPVHFPVRAKPRFMWKNYDPELNTFKRQPIRKHAQVLGPAVPYLVEQQVGPRHRLRQRQVLQRGLSLGAA